MYEFDARRLDKPKMVELVKAAIIKLAVHKL